MIYYTGAAGHLKVQINPSLSLGGYVSISQIPNAYPANLFASVTKKDLDNQRKEYVFIAFKNEESQPIENLELWLSPDSDAFSTYKFGFITPSSDSDSNPLFTKLQNKYVKPYGVTFYSADRYSNRIEYSQEIASGSYLGIIIERTITVTGTKSCDEITSDYEDGVIEKTQEDFSIEIRWGDDIEQSSSLSLSA